MIRLRTVGAVLIAAVCLQGLAGCETVPEQGSLSTVENEEIRLGKNLVQEDCRAFAAADAAYSEVAERLLNVFCGRWEHTSARVFQVSGAAAGADALDDSVTTSWWRQDIERRAVCADVEDSAILDGVEARVMDCQLKNGGWPYMVLATRVDGSVYLADGIPAALNVVETAIGIASGRLEPGASDAPSTRSAAVERLEAGMRGRLYGSGDLQIYYQLMTIAQYYDSIEEFPSAEKRYREALALQERLLGVNNPATVDPLMHVALELSNQGRFAEADALFGRVGPVVQQAIDQTDFARYLSYRAIHEANQGRLAAALQLARQATSLRYTLIARSAAPGAGGGAALSGFGESVARRDEAVLLVDDAGPTNAAEVVQSLYLEAAMLRRLGKTPESDAVLESAAALLSGAADAPLFWEPQILGLNASNAAARGAYESATQTLQTAIALWQDQTPNQRPTALALLELGKIYRREGRVDEALGAFRRAVRIVKDQGGGLRFTQVLAYFETALAAAEVRPAQRDQLFAEMFEAAQLVQSGATTHQIALAAARLAASDSGAGLVIRDLQDAEDERYFLEQAYEVEISQFDKPGHDQRLQRLSEQIVDINRGIQELRAQVQAASPAYNQLIDTEVSAERILRLVGPDEALVQVLLGGRQSFVFLVQGGRISAHRIDLTEQDAAGIVSRLREAFQITPEGTLRAYDVAASHELYQRILGPIADQVADAAHLITVPSGALLSLPFGLLVTQPPPAVRESDYLGVKWLAQRSAITLVPSVRSFVDLRAVAKSSFASKSFIGFGNFVPFKAEMLARTEAALPADCRGDAERLTRYRQIVQGLEALPITESEIRNVAATFPPDTTTIVLGSEFNEQTVRTAALSDYRIVYFATHALLPAEIECQPEPSLVASLSPGAAGDGFIQAGEILKLRLDADLVVLSACNTGGPGTTSGGESLSGLARAFFFAGARSLLVSHWPVEDTSTATLMNRVFAQMRDARTIGSAEALRLGQLSIFEQARRPQQRYLSHPFFWAAFTLVGDGARSVRAR